MTAPAATAPERAALWEDFLEIFIKPAAVFERRKAAGFAVPLLVLTVLFGLLFFGLKGAPSSRSWTRRTPAPSPR